jgi:hypothetical protein
MTRRRVRLPWLFARILGLLAGLGSDWSVFRRTRIARSASVSLVRLVPTWEPPEPTPLEAGDRLAPDPLRLIGRGPHAGSVNGDACFLEANGGRPNKNFKRAIRRQWKYPDIEVPSVGSAPAPAPAATHMDSSRNTPLVLIEHLALTTRSRHVPCSTATGSPICKSHAHAWKPDTHLFRGRPAHLAQFAARVPPQMELDLPSVRSDLSDTLFHLDPFECSRLHPRLD